jgi:hypothetical protein
MYTLWYRDVNSRVAKVHLADVPSDGLSSPRKSLTSVSRVVGSISVLWRVGLILLGRAGYC